MIDLSSLIFFNKGNESPHTPANLLCPWESIQNNILNNEKLSSTEKIKSTHLTKEEKEKVNAKENKLKKLEIKKVFRKIYLYFCDN